MASFATMDIGKELVDALGLPKGTSRVELHFGINDVVFIRADIHLDSDRAQALADVFLRLAAGPKSAGRPVEVTTLGSHAVEYQV